MACLHARALDALTWHGASCANCVALYFKMIVCIARLDAFRFSALSPLALVWDGRHDAVELVGQL